MSDNAIVEKLDPSQRPDRNKKSNCPFTYDELSMLYEWASQEYYYRQTANRDLQNRICEKLLRMLEKSEGENE